MNKIGFIAVLLVLLLAVGQVIKARPFVSKTTLVSAWNWTRTVAVCWTILWIIDVGLGLISPHHADHAWYLVIVLALCPPISVLGSRRPGSRVWTRFILLPMLFVLSWPVLTLWMKSGEIRGLQLELPQVVAYTLVLVMGTGNYCGTRYTLPALCFGFAAFIIVISSSTVAPGWLTNRIATRYISSTLMALAVWLAANAPRPPMSTRLDEIWLDFFDTFGIVWGRRIQDRVNHQCRQDQLPVRLELNGFEWNNPLHSEDSGKFIQSPDRPAHQQTPVDPASQARVEQILRWLLRRFVDPDWIDQRLRSTAESDSTAIQVDS